MLRQHRPLMAFWGGLLLAGCSPSLSKSMPASSDLGSPRGYRIARAIVHLHSPLSFDACYKHAYNLTTCLNDLRSALCTDRIDAAFLTDHIDSMATTAFSSLFQNQSGDTLVDASGNAVAASSAVANKVNCGGGQTALWMPGFEGDWGPAVMGLAMTQHYDATLAGNATEYNTPSAAKVSAIRSTTSGLMFAVHSEAWASGAPGNTLDISTMGLDGMEIYNLHAKMDPKIRNTYLGLDIWGNVPDLFVYWLDPWGQQQPDLAFLSFVQIAPVYAQIWDTLTTAVFATTTPAAPKTVAGVGGSDAHENFLQSYAHDGDLLDSYRRLMRWFSNHLLVTDMTYASIKAALQAGRGWLAFEGLGSPVGMDFYASASGQTTVGVGDTGTFASASWTITVPLPKLHSASPNDGHSPTIIIRLKRVSANSETVVATSRGASLSYPVTQAGAYRAEVSIIPTHLTSYVGYKQNLLSNEYPWIVTNHLYLQ